MNCKQYRSKAADRATKRRTPTPQEQNSMVAHCAVCPLCSKFAQEEEAVVAAWDSLTCTPAPDILPQLASRLEEVRRNQALPTTYPPLSRKAGYFGSWLTAGVTLGVLGAFAWMQNNKSNLYNTATIPSHSVMTQPATSSTSDTSEASLTQMLSEVRWRSSAERQERHEPPSYNEATRTLLLSERGVGK